MISQVHGAALGNDLATLQLRFLACRFALLTANRERLIEIGFDDVDNPERVVSVNDDVQGVRFALSESCLLVDTPETSFALDESALMHAGTEVTDAEMAIALDEVLNFFEVLLGLREEA